MEKELSMYMDPSYYTNRELSWLEFQRPSTERGERQESCPCLSG